MQASTNLLNSFDSLPRVCDEQRLAASKEKITEVIISEMEKTELSKKEKDTLRTAYVNLGMIIRGVGSIKVFEAVLVNDRSFSGF